MKLELRAFAPCNRCKYAGVQCLFTKDRNSGKRCRKRGFSCNGQRPDFPIEDLDDQGGAAHHAADADAQAQLDIGGCHAPADADAQVELNDGDHHTADADGPAQVQLDHGAHHTADADGPAQVQVDHNIDNALNGLHLDDHDQQGGSWDEVRPIKTVLCQGGVRMHVMPGPSPDMTYLVPAPSTVGSRLSSTIAGPSSARLSSTAGPSSARLSSTPGPSSARLSSTIAGPSSSGSRLSSTPGPSSSDSRLSSAPPREYMFARVERELESLLKALEGIPLGDGSPFTRSILDSVECLMSRLTGLRKIHYQEAEVRTDEAEGQWDDQYWAVLVPEVLTRAGQVISERRIARHEAQRERERWGVIGS